MKPLDAIGYVDDALVEKAESYSVKKNTWVKWGALAACICLIVGGIFLFPRTEDHMIVISHYETGMEGSYPVPGNGMVLYETAVREAQKEYAGEDVAFLLAFDIYENEEPVLDKQEEYQRLKSEGYPLYTAEQWTYQGKGEKVYDTVVVGCFTQAQLENFKSDPGYGYFFYFAKNGDGSEICMEKDDLITDFPINKS